MQTFRLRAEFGCEEDSNEVFNSFQDLRSELNSNNCCEEWDQIAYDGSGYLVFTTDNAKDAFLFLMFVPGARPI